MTSPPSRAPAAALAPPAAYPYWRRNMQVLFAANLLNNLGFTITFPYLPLILGELGAPGDLAAWVGWYSAILYASTVVLAPVWGGVADHFGRKSMVLRASMGQALGFTAMAFSGHLGLLLALVFWIGVCNGFIAASQALIATNTPPAAIGRALSNAQSGSLIGSTLGPLLGGALAGLLPAYRNLYFVGGATSVVASAVVLFLVREERPVPQGPFRLHLLRDLRSCLAVPSLGLLFYLLFLFSSTFFGSITIVSLYTLQLVREGAPLFGLGQELWLGIVTVSLTLSSAGALPFWGRVLDRFEPRRVLLVSLGLGLLATLAYPLVHDPLQLTGVRLVLGVAAVGAQPAILRLIKALSPVGMEARALAFGTSLYMMGHGAAPFLAGQIGPRLGLRAYFLFHSGLLLSGVLLWGVLGVRRARAIAGVSGAAAPGDP